MKDVLRKVFWPVLVFFEKGGNAEGYRPSHRKILLVVGFLFLVLSGVSLFFSVFAQTFSAILPIVLFFVISLVCFVVGLLGSDSAVARIWGSR
ncbi:hypothetical protein DIT71_12725 [Marinobacter vulgaris]|uniref:Uncharacterized protein n=1 Tax=Marinobacter vulgaris TaxID=1928331 RepID=A0A2V3ZJH6_9GAMM|nr:hypothetical protein [Marinobacter vulgaris]PXX90351.1 hypothetical protein DIT71_12725 [Marinobacter vulgaris]TSJ69623.1 hypothetical protein FPC41_11920 [Marinobacter vulgaris]